LCGSKGTGPHQDLRNPRAILALIEKRRAEAFELAVLGLFLANRDKDRRVGHDRLQIRTRQSQFFQIAASATKVRSSRAMFRSDGAPIPNKRLLFV
jgi:hypothetical protein